MNRRDLNRRPEPNRKFVQPGRHGPVLLETADPAFDRVPGLAALAVEDGRMPDVCRMEGSRPTTPRICTGRAPPHCRG